MGHEQTDIRLRKRLQLLWEYCGLLSTVTDHSVDGPRLSEYRKTFGQGSSPGGIIRKATVS